MRGYRYRLVICLLPLLLPFATPPQARAQRQITLGNATVALTGPWKFHTGDNMVWAQPDFDDSAWGTMDLTPPPGSFDPELGSSGFVPGWTVRGYKGYSGYAWYRLQTNVDAGQTALALKMPDNFDDAYQVYVDGRLVGQFGRFASHGVVAYLAMPRGFPLPANVHSGPVMIAIRMWMAAYTPLVDSDVGGLHGPPVIGQASTIAGLVQLDWRATTHSLYASFFLIPVYLGALWVAFGLFWLDRRELSYLWLGFICADLVATLLVAMVGSYTTWMAGDSNFLVATLLASPYTGMWVLFWAYWFRLSRMGLVHRAVWSLVAVAAIAGVMLRAPLYGGLIPVHAVVWLAPLMFVRNVLMGALLAWVIYRGIRKKRAEGWLAAPAVVLVVLALYQRQLHLPDAFFPFGIAISVSSFATVLSLAVITVLLLRRFFQSQHEREQFRMEMEQARQVQQVLIPEALPVIPGFTLESEYRPAQQVGGDFFQVIEAQDGSILIVLGDVTGHGLQAAMLVSLLVGAIRSTAQFDPDPLTMLQSLNHRLLGRGHANATCVALRVSPDGRVALANAGHLPPYLNGNEMTVEGALPLGVEEDVRFPVLKFQLQENDRLILMTDGVVEAQNEKRELFGFERVHELLQKPVTAAEVATAAQNFGQEDDISVLRIVRVAQEVRMRGAEPVLATV